MSDHRLRVPAAISRRRTVLPVLAVSSLLALVLGACGGPSARAPQAGRITIPATSAPPGVSTPATPDLSASNTAHVPTCSGSELTLAITQATNTLGQLNFTLRVTNAGQISCLLDGFPNVHALRADGSADGVAGEMAGLTAPAPVALQPGLSAIADLHVENGQPTGTQCERQALSAVEVRLGNAMVGRIHVPGNDAVCKGGSPGQFGVSAWAPGPDADAENDNDG
jgi:hypothetical protein